MKHNQSLDTIEVVWTKLILYGLTILLVLILFIIAPKSVFDKQAPFRLANSMAILEESNFMLYDYDVYSTQAHYEKALIDDVNEEVKKFRERNEILAIRIYGENNRIVVNDDYIIIYSPDAFDLNIEYYLVVNIYLSNVSLPARTFIMLFKDISVVVNNIYRLLFLVIFIVIFVPYSIKFSRSIIYVRDYRRTLQESVIDEA